MGLLAAYTFCSARPGSDRESMDRQQGHPPAPPEGSLGQGAAAASSSSPDEGGKGGAAQVLSSPCKWRREAELEVYLQRLIDAAQMEDVRDEKEGMGGSWTRVVVPVRHASQVHSWDCGLACLRMILDYVGYTKASQRTILAQIETNSIWTVELLYALQDYAQSTGRVVLLATKTPGICGGYTEVAFYARAIEQDSERIQRLFRCAHEYGLEIFEGGITWQAMRDLLWTGRVLIVVLVDSRYIPGPEGSKCPESFEGHYILLTGFIDGSFTYQDPGYPPEVSGKRGGGQRRRHRSMSPVALDLARKSFGTDEDVLIVEVAPKPMSRRSPASGSAVSEGEGGEQEEGEEEERTKLEGAAAR